MIHLLASLSLVWTLLLTPQTVTNQSRVEYLEIQSSVSLTMNAYGDVVTVAEMTRFYQERVLPFIVESGQFAKTNPEFNAIMARYMVGVYDPAGVKVWP